MGCANKRVQPEWVYFPPSPATPHVVHLKSFNSLGELVPQRVTFVDLIRGGAPSPYVEKPAGIDYQNGHLYICDTGLNVVHDWNLSTGTARRIGQRGPVVLQKPVDVTVSSDGSIFVADSERQEVVAFGTDGRFDDKYRPPELDAFRPIALDINVEKEPILAVADAANHELSLFVLEGSWPFEAGEHLRPFKGMPNETSGLYYPTGVAIHTASDDEQNTGTIFVSDMFNSRVMAYETKGETVRTIGHPGDRYGDLGQPKHLDVGPDGVIFVADAAFRCVHLFNQEGQLLMLLGGPADEPGGTPMPLGVTVAESLPRNLQPFVPPDFNADYFLFVTNTIGSKRISLFAVGLPRG